MQTFSQAVADWHDFYLMVGQASATLVGLLFVSLSLNARLITGGSSAGPRTVAEQTFVNFLSVLLVAIVFLIPNPGPLELGLTLVFIGSVNLYRAVRRLVKARHTDLRGWGKGSVGRAVGGSALCYATLLIVAGSVLLGRISGLFWLIPVMILLMVEASRNAWELLLRPQHPGAEA